MYIVADLMTVTGSPSLAVGLTEKSTDWSMMRDVATTDPALD